VIFNLLFVNTLNLRQAWWLMLVISTTWEAEMEKMAEQGQPGQKVFKTPSQPIKSSGGVCLQP
jgi:hypothetical protein